MPEGLRDPRDNYRWWVAACAAFVLAFGLFVHFKPAGEWAATVVDDLGSVLAALAVTLGALYKARRVTGRHRTGWLWLAAAGASWTLGEVIWSWYTIILSEAVPSPSVADVFYLAGSVPLAAIGILVLASNRGEMTKTLRLWLDGLIIASALLFVSWSTALGVVYRVGGGNLLARIVDLAYPVSDLVLSSAALIALSRVRGSRRRELGLIGAGVIAFAVADSAYTYLSYTNTYGDGSVFDTAYIAGYLLILLAALSAVSADPAPEEVRTVASPGQTMLPYAPLAVALVITVARALSGGRFDGLLVATGAVTVCLVLVRQWVTLIENRRLGQRLEASVAELRDREQELSHQASHDPLTGLANRVLFVDRIDEALARQRRRGGVVAVMVCDLDEFKSVNDSLGHLAGDELLREVAVRLVGCVRREDTVSRLGGDEFGVLLENVVNHEAAAEAAGRITRSVQPEFRVAGNRVVTTMSTGVALTHDGGESAEDLLRAADVALYEAKNSGRNTFCLYDQRMLSDVFTRLALKNNLAQLLDRPEQLEVHYQPILDLATGEVASVEALVRWRHPERGLLYPDAFIAEAESTGAIIALGSIVLRRACEQLASWRAGGTPCPSVSVNMSARQLYDPKLVEMVSGVLTENKLPAGSLILEMTESVMLTDLDEALERLSALRELGVRIAVDDFGTGYCSFDYLRRLPLDVLKIDKSFTKDIENDTNAAVLVDLMNQLAHTFGLVSVVEGVEETGHIETARLLSCDQAQGYLLARPATAEEITRLLRARVLPEMAARLGASALG